MVRGGFETRKFRRDGWCDEWGEKVSLSSATGI
jgi:hypothetical protein